MDGSVKKRCHLPLLLTVCKGIEKLPRIGLSLLMLFKQHLGYLFIQRYHKIGRGNVFFHLFKNTRIIYKPGQHQLLCFVCGGFLFLCFRSPGLWLDSFLCRRSLQSQRVDPFPDILRAHSIATVFLYDGFYIKIPLQFIGKLQKHPGTPLKKLILSLGCIHGKFLFRNMYTEHKAVHGPVQTFLKGLRSFILDELVRILPGLQAYYPGRDSRLPQDRDRTKGRPDPCTVTVIKKQDFLGVTFHKTCMSGGQCSSKRRHCIGKACLMHGDHIHISLTEDQIILPGGPGHIQPVKIPALIKDLRLR